jgi:hypothetical protein
MACVDDVVSFGFPVRASEHDEVAHLDRKLLVLDHDPALRDVPDSAAPDFFPVLFYEDKVRSDVIG